MVWKLPEPGFACYHGHIYKLHVPVLWFGSIVRARTEKTKRPNGSHRVDRGAGVVGAWVWGVVGLGAGNSAILRVLRLL